MKKLVIAVMFIAVMLAASGAWAYTSTFTSILSDSPGTVQVDVGIWDPSDNASPHYGTGFWGYVYDIKNVDYDTFFTNWAIFIPASVSVINVATPTGWTLGLFPGQMLWTAGTGYHLSVGESAYGFTVKSTYMPYTGRGTAWNAGASPAYGPLLAPGVPEPATAMLIGFGLIGLVGAARRKFTR